MMHDKDRAVLMSWPPPSKILPSRIKGAAGSIVAVILVLFLRQSIKLQTPIFVFTNKGHIRSL